MPLLRGVLHVFKTSGEPKGAIRLVAGHGGYGFMSKTLCVHRAQVEGDPDAAEAKRKCVAYKDIEGLALSFSSISHIDHLHGLNSLQKLQLDNNRITTIENLSHLVRSGVSQMVHLCGCHAYAAFEG